MADTAEWHTPLTRKLQIGERFAFVFEPSSISPGSKPKKLVLPESATLTIYRPAKTMPGSSFKTGRALIIAATTLTSMIITPPRTGVNHIMRNG